ncbi:MAG: S-adenosyl-L-methionine-dependent tRNA 4-demethylwyosine synthase [Promethearchaeota archaeon]|nr:MAG: S-adenosyl-L-methionine-dependent tRNA 4-demethylwyosine synthase [Candidatus Lokiarchaeota archaeon]
MNNSFIDNNQITNEFVEAYTKSNYRIIGNGKHSAIKPCHWLEQKLLTGRANRNCYKGVFGIESHRCLQNTPSLPFCNHQCVFCWRDIENGSLGSEFLVEPDDPRDLVEEMIRHQRNIIENHLPLRRYLDNYEVMLDILCYMLKNEGSQNLDTLSHHIHISKTKIQRALNLLRNQDYIMATTDSMEAYELEKEIRSSLDSREELELLINRDLTTPNDIMQAHSEALFPNHAAISLDGEPLLYPKISGLVNEFKKRHFTTFIVTNGTCPERLEALEALPSQLYITLSAPNEQIYKKVSRPMIKNGWDNIHASLDLVESLSTRTLIRLTAINNLNLKEDLIDDYIRIVEKANPDFFEIKGFTLQAKALLINKRLKNQKPLQNYFPSYEFLEEIATQFARKSGFKLIYTNKVSRDFLFSVNWGSKDPIIKHP